MTQENSLMLPLANVVAVATKGQKEQQGNMGEGSHGDWTNTWMPNNTFFTLKAE